MKVSISKSSFLIGAKLGLLAALVGLSIQPVHAQRRQPRVVPQPEYCGERKSQNIVGYFFAGNGLIVSRQDGHAMVRSPYPAGCYALRLTPDSKLCLDERTSLPTASNQRQCAQQDRIARQGQAQGNAARGQLMNRGSANPVSPR